MLPITNLNEIKRLLDIDPRNTNEDVKISFLAEMAMSWIGEYLNRPDLSYLQRTEYYGGSGTQKLLLRYRPVYYSASQPITVLYDENGYFGSVSGAFTNSNSQYVYGVDYCLKIDQPDLVTSRCGILVRINDYWAKPFARQQGLLSPFVSDAFGNFQVTYYAGYTLDILPAMLRTAAIGLVTKLRYFFPLGVALNSESYEDRSISIANADKQYLMKDVLPILFHFRNWKF